jgi:two-component system, OmpR family, response regulator
MRILLVEDDDILASGLNDALTKSGGYDVERMSSGLDADQALEDLEYDAILLDLNLPGLDGTEVLRRLRNRHSRIPVMIISARDSLQERISGLDTGADDYLAKPFKLPELEARLRALIRRRCFNSQDDLVLGSLRFNTFEYRAYIHDQPLDLSARETHVLELLMRYPNKVLSKQRFLDHLCGWQENITHNAIEVYISRLRKKLEPHSIQLRSIRGMGYLIEVHSSP